MSDAKPGFLAKQLGHGLRMFFTVYAKWISSSDDDLEMEKMDGMIGRTIPNVSPARKNGCWNEKGQLFKPAFYLASQ